MTANSENPTQHIAQINQHNFRLCPMQTLNNEKQFIRFSWLDTKTPDPIASNLTDVHISA